MKEILKLDHIQKYYGNGGNVTKAIQDISFSVQEGEFVGIMGASGSGKTTLLNCISTIDTVSAGHIYLDGTDVTEINEKQIARFRRENLGFVFQDFNLLDTLTISENIALALTIESICLLKLDNIDYSASIESIEVGTASVCSNENDCTDNLPSILTQSLPGPRSGVVISDYYDFCVRQVEMIKRNCTLRNRNVLVLGTEECMLPALLIGKAIEDCKEVNSIKCHATTRSPIEISNISGYPIESGFRIPSLYDPHRDTFIYNLLSYDVAVIISDTNGEFNQGLLELSKILKALGCQEILCLTGVNGV